MTAAENKLQKMALQTFSEHMQEGLRIIGKFREELKKGTLSYTSVSGEVADEVSQVFSGMGSVYMKCERSEKVELANYFAEVPETVEAYYGFLDELFKAGKYIDSYHGQIQGGGRARVSWRPSFRLQVIALRIACTPFN